MQSTTSTARRSSALTRRRRRRSSTALMACLAACTTVVTPASGFVGPAVPSRPPNAVFSATDLQSSTSRTSSSLFATTKKNDSASAAATSFPQQGLQRLSHEEQTALLNQAVEARRIRTLEQELALTTPRTSSELQQRQQLASKCGYDSYDDVQSALDAGHAARETLVTRNMGLVHYCVKDIMRKRSKQKMSLSVEDLWQEGAIGLARAVDRWDPSIGGRFSTYAVYWIRALVLRCIAERNELVRVPEHVSTAVRKVTRAAKTLGLRVDGEEDDDFLSTAGASSWKEAAAAKALAEEAGLTSRQVTEAIKVKQRRSVGVMSFESWMQQGQDLETDIATQQSSSSGAGSLEVERDHLKQTLSRFLRPREMEALSWRYGLNNVANEGSAAAKSHAAAGQQAKKRDYVAEAEEHLFGSSSAPSSNSRQQLPVRGKGGEALSFVEVGKRMQVSAEYGRRLCHAALNKLRQAADEGTLEPGLLF